MRREIFTSDRYFKVADFFTSHGQLLIRSYKGEKYECNIDIVFFDTAFMQISASLQGFTVSVSEDRPLEQYPSIEKYLSFDQSRLFQIEANNGEKYFIAASFVRIFENELAFKETSLGVFGYQGRDKQIAASL